MTQTTKRKRKGPPKGHGTTTAYYAGCRCKWCKAANSKYIKKYREENFHGTKCRVKKCHRQAASGTGNGLCRHHDEMLKARREELEKEARKRKRKVKRVAA